MWLCMHSTAHFRQGKAKIDISKGDYALKSPGLGPVMGVGITMLWHGWDRLRLLPVLTLVLRKIWVLLDLVCLVQECQVLCRC